MRKALIVIIASTLHLFMGDGLGEAMAQESYQQADSLCQLYLDKQSADTALVYAKKALHLVEEQYGKNDTLYADMLHGLVNAYYYSGKYEEAITYSKEEVAIRIELQGKENVNYILSIGLLGELYTNTDQYQEALPLFLEALKTTEKTLGKEDSDYGYHLNNLALLYYYTGQYREALPLFLEALENTENSVGKEHLNYGIRLSNLTLLYQDMGRYQQALSLSLEALVSTEKSVGKEHPEYATRLNNLSLVYMKIGQGQKAVPLLLEALELTEKTLGKEHYRYGLRLENLAYVYQAMGQYQEALHLFLEAKKIIENSLGKEHSDYATCLSNLAVLYQTMGQHQEALPLFLEAMEITEKIVGIEHSDYGTRLGNLATLYLIMGQSEKALALYLDALENTEKSLGKDHPYYGTRLNGLANCYKGMGEYEKALSLYLEALENSEIYLGKEHSGYGIQLTNLATYYQTMGEYEKALPLLVEALENCKINRGKEHSDYGIQLDRLGSLYKEMGWYEKAIPIYAEALEITERALGKEHLYYSGYLHNMAVCYKDMGRYRDALPLYLEALEIAERSYGKEHTSYGESSNDLAVLYQHLGQNHKALSMLLKALENTEKTLGKAHYRYAIRLNNLASSYSALEQHSKTIPLYLEALEIIENSLGKEHAYYAYFLSNLAFSYRKEGQYQKALSSYLEAMEITEKSVGKAHSQYGIQMVSLAAVYKTMGNSAATSEEKKEYYQKALPLVLDGLENCENSLGREHPHYGTMLSHLTSLYRAMAQSANTPREKEDFYRKALPLFTEGIENVNNNLEQNFAFLSEKEKEAYFNTISQRFDRYNSFALETKSLFEDITTTVFNNTVRNKNILLKSSTAMRTAVLNSNDTALIAKYEQWINLNIELQGLYSTPVTKRQKDINQLEEQATVLERDLVSNSQEFSAFTQTLKTNWEDVQRALKPNEIAIEFVHFEDGTDTTLYCALIVSPKSRLPYMLPLFREKQLEELLGKYEGNSFSYINGLYGQNSEGNTELYKLIWAPIDSVLSRSTGEFQNLTDNNLTIYVSPSGLLHRISFSAIAKDHNVYLCDVYHIEVKTTTAKLVENHQLTKSNQISTAAVFGGINYDTDRTNVRIWKYLEGTKTEAETIYRILNKRKAEVSYYSNSNATEEQFKLLASNSNIMHVATHGFFYPDPEEAKQEAGSTETDGAGFGAERTGYGVWSFVENENPLMRSGLVFAGANDVWTLETDGDTDDGILTAQEVVQIDMRETDLVVMSACETGLGEIKGSEGVYGLQRAFKMAGVQYMIMSLWQVPDKETEELMTSFYRRLMKKKNIKIAFAETQNRMRQKYDPYYWAAFVLID